MLIKNSVDPDQLGSSYIKLFMMLMNHAVNRKKHVLIFYSHILSEKDKC